MSSLIAHMNTISLDHLITLIRKLSFMKTFLDISLKLRNVKEYSTGSRCIKEEAHKDVLVVGEFTVENIPSSHEVDIMVSLLVITK